MTHVSQYRPGSPEDFHRLDRDSPARILRTLVALLGDVAAAEDCTQDAPAREVAARVMAATLKAWT